jgi:hypothetical protein
MWIDSYPCPALAAIHAKKPGTLRSCGGTRRAVGGTSVDLLLRNCDTKAEQLRLQAKLKRVKVQYNRYVATRCRHIYRNFSPNRHKEAFHKGANRSKKICKYDKALFFQ